MRFLIVFLLALHLNFGCESFLSANEFYYQGDYTQALQEYKKCVKTPSYSLYYNLGNLYFKLENYGLSRYNYEMALVLDPSNKNLKYNLKMLGNKLSDDIDSKLFVSSTLFDLEVEYILVILSFIFSISFVFRKKYGRILWVASLIFIVMILFTYSSLFFKSVRSGIILPKETQIYSSQDQSSAVLGRVHTGYKVKILQVLKDWVLVEFRLNNSGWVPAQEIAIIGSLNELETISSK
ncbi:tetratricopeptide repeat protein [bacterium]|nr:tetratricopeptide repeat protein [bacterium]